MIQLFFRCSSLMHWYAYTRPRFCSLPNSLDRSFWTCTLVLVCWLEYRPEIWNRSELDRTSWKSVFAIDEYVVNTIDITISKKPCSSHSGKPREVHKSSGPESGRVVDMATTSVEYCLWRTITESYWYCLPRSGRIQVRQLLPYKRISEPVLLWPWVPCSRISPRFAIAQGSGGLVPPESPDEPLWPQALILSITLIVVACFSCDSQGSFGHNEYDPATGKIVDVAFRFIPPSYIFTAFVHACRDPTRS